MWLITPFGFLSIVRKPEDKGKGTLTVRARVRDDLEEMENRYRLGLGPISESSGTDYRFRAKVRATDLAAAMVKIVADIDYSNFKNRVKETQGSGRAQAYGEVWGALHNLQSPAKPAAEVPVRRSQVNAAGGVLPNADGHILLREPTGHFDGYIWTFPKGKIEAGSGPKETALREVREETGFDAEIVGTLPGIYVGGTSCMQMFLMRPVGQPEPFDTTETASVRWAHPEEARELVKLTRNALGRERDLKIIEDAFALMGPPETKTARKP